MCRHLAYLGPRITIEAVLLDGPHSLFRQSWEPHQQTAGVVNADGFGVGWYDPERRREPARYRSPRPIWADASFASLAGVVTAPAVLAAVRSATPPSLVEESSTPPFTAGPWLFSHNGAVDGFREGGAARLRRHLSDARSSGILGTSDSELLFAVVLDRLDAGCSLATAIGETVACVRGVVSGRLNLLATDGDEIVATRQGESLYVHESRTRDAPSVTVASEPVDDSAGWTEVPDGTLVVARPGAVGYRSLEEFSGD
jgi:glutamine amidotransferase